METETWKPVIGWEGLYEVSDHGRVRSLNRISRFKIRSKIIDVAFRGRVMKPSLVDGYPQLHLRKVGCKQQRKVHLLLLEAFVGPCPEGQQARHLDGVKGNCRLENLKWGTPLENGEDRIRHGRVKRGELQHLARLTAGQVREIRSHFAATGNRKGLAAKYGVDRATIYSASVGKTWGHVQ